jgi:hypothetical protein
LPTPATTQKSRGLPDKPEEFGSALAHVISRDGNKEVVLGQAWIVGAGKLATCGHVVESYVQNPSDLLVFFPSSGHNYQVRGIKMHPSFVRQPDNLVKYDAALLYVDLGFPERQAAPLPLQFEKTLSPQQPLSAVRFPAHLGQISGSPNALAQLGTFLGPLRKHDNFHLLHDLALSPGDSGAPIFDGKTVVALHCGDTATLPGLNLPTTSIRMALWIDALREMGVTETYFPTRKTRLAPIVWAAVCAFILAFASTAFVLVAPSLRQWQIQQPRLLPVDISFNKPLNGYTSQDDVAITISPRSDCFIHLFYIDNNDNVLMLYPPYGDQTRAQVNAGESRVVDRLGSSSLKASPEKGKLRLVALNSADPLLRDTDFDKDASISPLKIKGAQLEKLVQDEIQKDPEALDVLMDAPSTKADDN